MDYKPFRNGNARGQGRGALVKVFSKNIEADLGGAASDETRNLADYTWHANKAKGVQPRSRVPSVNLIDDMLAALAKTVQQGS